MNATIQAVTAEFTLTGACPSKKNSKMLTRGRLITKPAYQAALQSLTLQAQANWRSEPLTDAHVDLEFLVSSFRQDIDNATAGLMDCLKDAGVIADDNMAHVRCIVATRTRVAKGLEGVRVRITGLPLEGTK